MTKDEALKLALEALEISSQYSTKDTSETYYKPIITAIKQVLANDALEKMAENARELGLDYEPNKNEFKPDWDEKLALTEEVIRLSKRIEELEAQPEPKYHRGNRLICLETEEYCVIHISGTDRQWVKFPDSYIGVYTNEQVAELFELLPKEPEQEPVATLWQHGETGRTRITMPDDITDCDARWFKAADLYTTPPQQELVCVCGAVWEGQKLIYTTPQRLPLTDDEIKIIWCDIDGSNRVLMRFARAIEAAVQEKQK